MPKSLTRRILESHSVEGEWKPGSEISIKVDQTLTQDATGTMACLQFETMGVPRVRTELSVSYIDHNTLQVGFENADDHRYLASIAARYGMYLSRAGNGICHQVHLERFGRPGATLLGSDSHTPTGGGIGMIAIGAGGLDVAMAMAGKPFNLACPKVTGIHLTGALKEWSTAKDVVLSVLKVFGTKGNVGTVFEYFGEGVATLSVPERATIANMGAECGVTTSVFPSDEATRSYLKACGREHVWKPMAAEPGAEYDCIFELDLGSVEPLAATPHSPGNVATVASIAGLEVDQVCIGSCTNSSYKDLATVATMLEGREIHKNVSLVVTPGSRQVLRSIDESGHLAMLVGAGARIVEPSCSFCIGSGHSPASGAVSLRSSNRNFEGRSGTADARVFLVSPETAAAAALSGRIVDPRDQGIPYPGIQEPESYLVDDRMLTAPLPENEAVEITIVRGPNIGNPPASSPFPKHLVFEVGIKVGDKITTDHIMPAGARMKFRSNIDAYSRYVFEHVDPGFPERAAGIRDSGLGVGIVAGLSYGQGSSREHAAICPAKLGVRIILAKSFERIHAANLVNFGILPLEFLKDEEYLQLGQGDRLEMAIDAQILNSGDPLIAMRTDGRGFGFTHALTPRQVQILIAGGALA